MVTTRRPAPIISQKALDKFREDFPDERLSAGIQLLKGFRILAQRTNDVVSARLAPHGLSGIQFSYLAILHANRRDGLTAGDLGTAIGTTTGAVTTMVDWLERERLVERHDHPSDGRSVLIKITQHGRQIYREAAATHYAFVTAVIEKLGLAKSRRMLASLAEVVNALEAEGS